MKKIIVSLSLFLAATAFAENPFYWKEGNVTHYSDVPHNLRTKGVSEFNVRTHTVRALKRETADGREIQIGEDGKELSLADQQLELSRKIAERNKKIEEDNKRRAEENKKENCRIAQINLKNAQTANRMEGREEAIAGYERDIAKYCN